MGMLHTRYNKDGAKVLVEKENLEVFEKQGYKLKAMPEVKEVDVEEVVEASVEEKPAKEEVKVEEKPAKPAAKRGRKPVVKKAEKDIVLD